MVFRSFRTFLLASYISVISSQRKLASGYFKILSTLVFLKLKLPIMNLIISILSYDLRKLFLVISFCCLYSNHWNVMWPWHCHAIQHVENDGGERFWKMVEESISTRNRVEYCVSVAWCHLALSPPFFLTPFLIKRTLIDSNPSENHLTIDR